VTGTIWLASYPKSGNTWFRMLLANLSARDGRPVDINELPEHSGMASARAPFDHFTLIDSGLLTHEEIDSLRPRIYEALARGDEADEALEPGTPTRFVKAHDAYTLTPAGDPLLAGSRGADGAIVIVRDPRDVAVSLAHHQQTTIDQAIAFMNDANAGFCAKTTLQYTQLRQRLLGWSGHVASWLDQPDIPVHPLRYEDLRADTAGALRLALAFAGLSATDGELRRAVAGARFEELRRQEQARGFGEAHRQPLRGNFFRRGEAGAWRDELTSEQVARIEADHAPTMRRLGYAPEGHRFACADATADKLARLGEPG
jgi:aryl sulfotransferase